MNTKKWIAMVLIIAGTLGLAYGGFSYTKASRDVKLGPIELTVKDRETISVPIWAGIGAIVVGSLILLVGGKGR